MTTGGYYQFPTIHDDTIAFVSEDDLWCVSATGGEARRLTSGLGSALHPAYSGTTSGSPSAAARKARLKFG